MTDRPVSPSRRERRFGFPPGRGPRLALALACLALASVPFLVVELPPSTDLPQQVHQMRLLSDVLSGAVAADAYRVQWHTPNTLSYLFLIFGWLVAQAVGAGGWVAGRIALASVVGVGILGLHLLAARRGRSATAAAVASVFFLNHLVVWGLLSFAVGVPVFFLWLVVTERSDAAVPEVREGGAILGVAALLYWAHALWLVAGLVWLVVDGLARRLPRRRALGRLLWASPIALVAALAWPSIAVGGLSSPTEWDFGLLERLSPGRFLYAALGGVPGWVEPLVFLAVVAWCGVGLWRAWRGDGPGPGVDGRLLGAGGLLLLASLLLPDLHSGTINFAVRWAPAGWALVVLALPAPLTMSRRRSGVSAIGSGETRMALSPLVAVLVALLALAPLAALSAATARAWMDFERREMAGFSEALDAVPPGSRLLGLDFAKLSRSVYGAPFSHQYLWAAVDGDVEPAYSFAAMPSSLVVHRELPWRPPWPLGMEQASERVRREDLASFDRILVHGGEEIQASFVADPRFEPVTGGGVPWRLFRVAPELRSRGAP